MENLAFKNNIEYKIIHINILYYFFTVIRENDSIIIVNPFYMDKSEKLCSDLAFVSALILRFVS